MDEPMNLNRFAAIVDAFGGAPARWPDAERAAAIVFMKSSPEAQRLVEEAEALDGMLDMPETAPATRELQDRIMSALPAAKFRGPRVAATRGFRWSKWIPAAAVTCSLALGVALGTQLPQIVGLDDESLALQAASTAMAGSANDGELLGGSE